MNLYEISNVSNLTLLKNAVAKGLRLGYMDIETSPKLSMNYGDKKVFIGHENVIRDTQITSVVILKEGTQKAQTYKWDFKGNIAIQVKGGRVTTTGGGDDSVFLRKVVKELDKFDIVIMQNGDGFDAKVLQDRLCDLRLPPIRNLITLDTLKLSRRSFRRNSHKLDARSLRFGYGGKIKQDMNDSMLVMAGDKEKEIERLKYNIKDVFDMRQVFWRELDYYNFHSTTINLLRLFLHEQKPYCVKCAARHEKKFDVEARMVHFKSGGKGKRYQCNRCFHHWPIPKVL